MILESIETLNERLINIFGKFNGQPKFRIVWSEDQYEKRLTKYSKEGLELLQPQMVELPKYKQWIHNKYILEQLVPVPENQLHELTTALSYEPLWVFEDNQGNALPPKWQAIHLLIHNLYAQMDSSSVKYKDPEATPEGAIEEREKRLAAIQEQLFGNESNTTDALAHNQAVIVPRNYEVN